MLSENSTKIGELGRGSLPEFLLMCMKERWHLRSVSAAT